MSGPAVVIAPDSFKGCLDAAGVAKAIGGGILRVRPDASLVELPLADGGEGTMDCLAASLPDSAWQSVDVCAVHGKNISARWLRLDTETAVIESAEVLGLPLVADAKLDVLDRGSASLGLLILDAMASGCQEIFLALGGSATNDCGIGMLQTLGMRFTDASGQLVPPTLKGLMIARRCDRSGLDGRLAACRLTVLCDVDNPLCGQQGASAVYGPQKGLDSHQIAQVDAAFAQFAELLCGRHAAAVTAPGAGAAGGLGFALSQLDAVLAAGADRVLDLCNFAHRATGSSLVITGEGRADTQTLHGKLPAAVAHRASDLELPVALVAGAIAPEAEAALAARFACVESLTAMAGSSDQAIAEAPHWLARAGERIARRFLS